MAEMPVGVHWPVVHRARELQAGGTPIALLTNNVEGVGRPLAGDVPGRRAVRDRRRLVRRRHAQARPAIYLLTCERIGVAPEASVFIDDNAENIAAARALGMETVHFGEDPFVAVAELDAILERRGTVPPLTRARLGTLGRAARVPRTRRVSSRHRHVGEEQGDARGPPGAR